MNKPELSKSVDKVVALKQLAADIVIKALVKPLEIVGNPEDLIGKPYEAWTREDIQNLSLIYGVGDHTPLATTIFNHEYEKVKNLERELENA